MSRSSSSQAVDAIVIGAGVVGLAVARALAITGRETLLLESEDAIGTATSSRNSEVIHAGIAYASGSAKGRLCVRGRDLLYDYAVRHRIEHRRCGKLVVATNDAEIAGLERVVELARGNGVDDLAWLSGKEARSLEPELACVAALLSPSTGIVDSHALMSALRADFEAHGGALVLRSPVVAGRRADEGIELDVGGSEPSSVVARLVVNSAGLGAQRIAAAIEGFPAEAIPALHLAKGSYFTLRGAPPFSRLIYPVPGPASLGTHFTRDLSGRGRFGPDLEWVDRVDYAVDPAREAGFAAAIRRYWPALPDDALDPGYAGIRPKIQAPGAPLADFVIRDEAAHGFPGLVNLFGIESPGLTACLAIAEEIVETLA